MKEYLNLLNYVKDNGIKKEDRTGTGTLSVFGKQFRFDLNQGFPLLTTKKIHLKSVIHELLWFLKGNTNIKYLKDHGVSIWDEWADENGDLGPVYGSQWRSWPTSNGGLLIKLTKLVDSIKNNPNSRRLIVSLSISGTTLCQMKYLHAIFFSSFMCSIINYHVSYTKEVLIYS